MNACLAHTHSIVQQLWLKRSIGAIVGVVTYYEDDDDDPAGGAGVGDTVAIAASYPFLAFFWRTAVGAKRHARSKLWLFSFC